jgi:hypothetical protein
MGKVPSKIPAFPTAKLQGGKMFGLLALPAFKKLEKVSQRWRR